MAGDKTLRWEKGVYLDEHLMYANDEHIAHIFPRDGKPGFTLCTRDHGGWWGQTPGQHYDTVLQAQYHAKRHGQEYFQQEERNLKEMGQHSLLNDLKTEWQRMGGDPKTMNDFQKEWERKSAAQHDLKVPDRGEEGHER